MLKGFRKTKQPVEFCERCEKVFDAARRQNMIIEQARDRALRRGWKFV
jgi:hypothetical protein